jgi:uncharacterized protein involved in exopolysaccharide biosynthesis
MQELNLRNDGDGIPSPTLRDILVVAFRHWRLIALSFIGILSGAILTVLLQPNLYQSEIKILVKRDRADPIVTSDSSALPQLSPEVTEAELNSEVVLLKSRALLEKVVLACNLQKQNYSAFSKLLKPISAHRADEEAEDMRVARVVRALEKELKVEVVKRTNVIAASYESSDPQLAARVLTTLGSLYLERHVAVHRPPGAFDFFQEETLKYRAGLTNAQARLVDFNHSAAVVSAPLEKAVALQKLAEFDGVLRQTEASIAETQQRISILKQEAASTPTRMTTQVRKADDGMLLSQLRSNLLTLEQKRSELLGKYEPGYRPVQEVDDQMAQVRAALASAEKSQLHEETTDRDPTYEWLRGELAKAKADLAGLEARAKITAQAVRSYQENARSLQEKEIIQDDFIRNVKAAEDNYLLYLRKEEQARISDALDRGRILNVVIAEAAAVPSVPSNRRFLGILVGMLMATFISIGLAVGSDHLDPTFRTPDEVGSHLDIPVLAAIPRTGEKSAIANGFSSG